MKLKISQWGNSNGLRIPSAIMEHLNIQAGEEVEIKLTGKGIEIVKKGASIDYLNLIKEDVLNVLLEQTKEVQRVQDPYEETQIAYTVININPNAPLIREVPKGTENSYNSLADAKEAVRQTLQSSIEEAQRSLSSLRQIGIENINYISL